MDQRLHLLRAGHHPCDCCRRRPRRLHGNDSCHLLERRPELSEDEEWIRHKDIWDAGCSSFVLGDSRRKVKPEPQESLFDE